MMKIKILPIVLAVGMFFCMPAARAVTLSEIETSGRYYFGKSDEHPTLAEADEEAMRLLMTSISANVVVDVYHDHQTNDANGVYCENNKFQSMVRTYTSGRLNNVESLQLGREGSHRVVRYVLKSEVNKVFEERKRKIASMVNLGDLALEEGKIDVAIRNYNWALNLLNTLPYPSEEKYGDLVLSAWLPAHIDNILRNLRVAVYSKNGLETQLYFSYLDKPVSSLDFKYRDMGHMNSYTAKDGMAMIELTENSDTTMYNVIVECNFRNQYDLDPEVKSVMELQTETPFPSAAMVARPGGQFNRILPDAGTDEPEMAHVQPLARRESFSLIPASNGSAPAESSDHYKLERCQRALDAIVNAVSARNYDIDGSYFTDSGYHQFQGLIGYGRGRVVGTPEFHFTDFMDYTMARGMQMAFSFRHGAHRRFVEDLVFTFDRDCRICNITFGLGRTTEDNIMRRIDIPEDTRKYLCMFVENYQTAYAFKDADYIEGIFDEYAKIITVTLQPTMSRGLDGSAQIRMNQHERRFNNRESFIEHLKRSFASKEFINLRFNSVAIDKAKDGRELYGLMLEQDYYSSNYCDHGYLLLGINMENQEHPSIFVRTWQQEEDERFGYFRLHHFYHSDNQSYSTTPSY